MQGGVSAIGALRMHDGCLTQSQVSYNFMTGSLEYLASPTPSTTQTPSNSPSHSVTPSQSSTQLNSLSNTPSASPTASGTPCPSSFGFTHVLNAVSLTLAVDSSAYVRHCNYQLWVTPNYQSTVGNIVDTMDATQIQRIGLDGSSGVSFESDNYQNHWLQVQPTTGWLIYAVSTTVFSTPANRAAATFTVVPLANGNVQLLSHHPDFYGWPVTASNVSYTLCAGKGPALNVSRPGAHAGIAQTAWTYQAPLASAALYNTRAVEYANTAPYQSERVVLESLGAPGRYLSVVGGASTGQLAVAAPSTSSFYSPTQAAGATMLAPSYSWALRPALDCPFVCTATGVSTFSLLGASGTSTAIFNYAGASYVGGIGSGYGAGDASLITFRATVNGTSGYVVSSLNDYSAGNVWTITPGSGNVVSSPVPASGLAVSHLWRFSWEDGSGDLMANGFPSVPGGEAGEPACPSMSATPLPTTSQTPSFTPCVEHALRSHHWVAYALTRPLHHAHAPFPPFYLSVGRSPHLRASRRPARGHHRTRRRRLALQRRHRSARRRPRHQLRHHQAPQRR